MNDQTPGSVEAPDATRPVPELDRLRAEIADLRILDRQRQAAATGIARERDELRRQLVAQPSWFARQLRRVWRFFYWTITGRLKTQLMAIYQTWRHAPLLAGQPDNALGRATAVKPIVPELVAAHFSVLRPIEAFRSPGIPRRLTLVTDSINAGSLFGGVATAIVLAAELAKATDRRLRVLTLTEAAIEENVRHVLDNAGIDYPGPVEFAFADPKKRRSVDLGDDEIFLTTSWWSTHDTRRIAAPAQIIYLLQEDERDFYPAGDQRLRCAELLRDPRLRFVLNTRLLRDHLVAEGFDNIGRNGLWFEPAFPAHIYRADRPQAPKKNFFFYARPNNVRNLFYRGLEAVDEAVQRRILDPAEWDFHFAGRDLDPALANLPYRPSLSQNLSWSQYAALISRMDLGLALMYTPHPSYPPLDLAAAGAVAVTNRYGLKQDLSAYSGNIICADTAIDSLVTALEAGAKLACNQQQRTANFAASRINRSWSEARRPVVDALSQPCS